MTDLVSEIYDAIASSVTVYADGKGLPISVPGVGFEPPGTGMWLELLMFPNGDIPYGISNNGPTVVQGFFRVLVFSRVGYGVVTPFDLAGEIVALYKKGTRLGPARVEIAPTISGLMDEEDRVAVPVTVRYKATRVQV